MGGYKTRPYGLRNPRNDCGARDWFDSLAMTKEAGGDKPRPYETILKFKDKNSKLQIKVQD